MSKESASWGLRIWQVKSKVCILLKYGGRIVVRLRAVCL